MIVNWIAMLEIRGGPPYPISTSKIPGHNVLILQFIVKYWFPILFLLHVTIPSNGFYAVYLAVCCANGQCFVKKCLDCCSFQIPRFQYSSIRFMKENRSFLSWKYDHGIMHFPVFRGEYKTAFPVVQFLIFLLHSNILDFRNLSNYTSHNNSIISFVTQKLPWLQSTLTAPTFRRWWSIYSNQISR